MTSLEKQSKVKDVLFRMCGYGDGCPDCDFFNPEDNTDGDHWCAIRDNQQRIPFDDDWDFMTGMLGD